ncbi:hypothetical protein QR680_003207 [Steinernema hermaphroditum]|uniref:C2H2-type domain-containing protein n=1 Tax=Steinernema hermaphroditum TaxID=289476 RepID=A0AA39LJW2_9BILA|nr:hypothetical protein QR680_003207 [Steinernema hermaphroditum]
MLWAPSTTARQQAQKFRMVSFAASLAFEPAGSKLARKSDDSYTAPLPPSVAVPVSRARLTIPKVLPIVPKELLGDEDTEPTTMTHMQYNSPMPLYSRESAEEQYRQQIGAGSVPNIGSSDKHFDPEKSATLRAIQEQEQEDEFGKNFFEKVAAAEAPKVPRDIEPAWASQARERSERARSHTPATAQRLYQAQQDAIPMHPPSNQAIPMGPPPSDSYSQAIPLGPPQSQTQYTNYQPQFTNYQQDYQSHTLPRTNYAQSYKQQHVSQRDKVVPERGYEFGGMDYTGNLPKQDDGYQYYPSRPKTPVREEKPGYKMGGMDFAENIRYSGYNPNYHGHGPDEPRLRSVFSADPHSAVNTYVASNVEGVNPIRLVGDTISNQKCRFENNPTAEQKANMGTSFAPPAGHRPEHRTMIQPPKPQEPLCYSLSAKKGRGLSPGGYYGSHVRAQSAGPGLDREQWTAEKEVTVETLLNDQALRPIRRSMTPDWADRSLQKHDSWRHTLDPRLNRPQIFHTEPNWSRTVNERRQAWEHQAASTDARVNLPAAAKVPPQQPPYWANKANTTHRVWQTAADRNLLSGQEQQQYYGGGGYESQAQYGAQYGGGYGAQGQQDYGYSTQQQQSEYSQQAYQQQQQQQRQQQQQQQQYQYQQQVQQQQAQQNGYPSGQRTTYSYSSQQAPVQSTPLQMDQASFTRNKVTTMETTTTAPQTQAIALPAPTSGGQYQQYSASEQRYEKRSQEQHQEERVSRPVSYHEEQRDYQRSYKKETSEQRTVQPAPAPVPQSQVQSVTVSNDAFDRRAEMRETLPRGSLSNTQANAAGEYVDQEGRNVLYKRELTTSADPGREYQLLKEEERRVTERPLEPGVISRHVTTKYYKKKTVTDTQQTMMSEEPVAKKCRVWNPALDDGAKPVDVLKVDEKIAPIGGGPAPGVPGFGAPPFVHPHNLPFFINNYFQLAAPLLAHFQQQQLHASQKALLDQLTANRNMKQAMLRPPVFPPTSHHPMPPPPSAPIAHPAIPQQPPSVEVPTSSGRSANPIVLSAIGSSVPINQNCCAICGASFRLTGDLVQHMRSNHRNSKYRRRNHQHNSSDSH